MKKLALASLLFLFFTACFDSTHPLSSPEKAVIDKNLEGLWRSVKAATSDDEFGYVHIGHPGEKSSNQRQQYAVVIGNKNGELEKPGEYYFFPSTIGNHRYLNLVDCKGDSERCSKSRDRGMNTELVEKYFLIRYEIKGNDLTLTPMDKDAIKQAIESGKVKGKVEMGDPSFLDSTEHLASFFKDHGDALFSKPGNAIRLKRVK